MLVQDTYYEGYSTYLILVEERLYHVNTEVSLSFIHNISNIFGRRVCEEAFASTTSHIECIPYEKHSAVKH